MKKIKLYCFIVISMSYIQVRAQQDVTYTLYNYNMNVINPAYAGVGETPEFTSNFRSQWAGLEGGPEIQSFSAGVPINEKIGLGFSIVNSSVFVLKEIDVTIDFSYKVPVTETLDLFLGIKALGGSLVQVDLTRAGVENDPLFTENISEFNPNIGIGAYLRGGNFYVNVSAPAILKTNRYEKESGIATEATDKLHFYAGAGYHFSLKNDMIFTPSVLTRMVSGVPLSMDISGTLNMNNTLEFGISHRLKESISGLVFFKITDSVRAGYAYDSSITAVKNYGRGNHEVILKFRLNNPKKQSESFPIQ
ncbi:type IX secretion system membrane protein PorP/SprF [Flavivirga aquimarina]|uniref:Type IX secretion system membrane protein PorP/SprF n=1 Tax=Flavivirga aquimarina TaxID=2027862 RepID=A0ABT8W5W7_9FLAO|nr:type IX secretion system membrane protein PorP/SprF [Flavivirga aquimarina]MDO5968501.1 type IX secretion system membrane protein PorP/SprF [Flavivirga aquimarina]